MSEKDLDKLKQLAQEKSPDAIAYLDQLRDADVKKLESYARRNYRAIKKLARATMLILSMLTAGLLAVGVLSIKLSSENSDLNKGTYGSCHRLNIVRAVDNENDYINYSLFKSILILFQKSSKKILLPEEKLDREIFVQPLENIVNRAKWIPLTNCIAAVQHPFTYIPPQPISFSEQKPSYYAFHLGPDN